MRGAKRRVAFDFLSILVGNACENTSGGRGSKGGGQAAVWELQTRSDSDCWMLSLLSPFSELFLSRAHSEIVPLGKHCLLRKMSSLLSHTRTFVAIFNLDHQTSPVCLYSGAVLQTSPEDIRPKHLSFWRESWRVRSLFSSTCTSVFPLCTCSLHMTRLWCNIAFPTSWGTEETNIQTVGVLYEPSYKFTLNINACFIKKFP